MSASAGDRKNFGRKGTRLGRPKPALSVSERSRPSRSCASNIAANEDIFSFDESNDELDCPSQENDQPYLETEDDTISHLSEDLKPTLTASINLSPIRDVDVYDSKTEEVEPFQEDNLTELEFDKNDTKLDLSEFPSLEEMANRGGEDKKKVLELMSLNFNSSADIEKAKELITETLAAQEKKATKRKSKKRRFDMILDDNAASASDNPKYSLLKTNPITQALKRVRKEPMQSPPPATSPTNTTTSTSALLSLASSSLSGTALRNFKTLVASASSSSYSSGLSSPPLINSPPLPTSNSAPPTVPALNRVKRATGTRRSRDSSEDATSLSEASEAESKDDTIMKDKRKSKVKKTSEVDSDMESCSSTSESKVDAAASSRVGRNRKINNSDTPPPSKSDTVKTVGRLKGRGKLSLPYMTSADRETSPEPEEIEGPVVKVPGKPKLIRTKLIKIPGNIGKTKKAPVTLIKKKLMKENPSKPGRKKLTVDTVYGDSAIVIATKTVNKKKPKQVKEPKKVAVKTYKKGKTKDKNEDSKAKAPLLKRGSRTNITPANSRQTTPQPAGVVETPKPLKKKETDLHSTPKLALNEEVELSQADIENSALYETIETVEVSSIDTKLVSDSEIAHSEMDETKPKTEIGEINEDRSEVMREMMAKYKSKRLKAPTKSKISKLDKGIVNALSQNLDATENLNKETEMKSEIETKVIVSELQDSLEPNSEIQIKATDTNEAEPSSVELQSSEHSLDYSNNQRSVPAPKKKKKHFKGLKYSFSSAAEKRKKLAKAKELAKKKKMEEESMIAQSFISESEVSRFDETFEAVQIETKKIEQDKIDGVNLSSETEPKLSNIVPDTSVIPKISSLEESTNGHQDESSNTNVSLKPCESGVEDLELPDLTKTPPKPQNESISLHLSSSSGQSEHLVLEDVSPNKPVSVEISSDSDKMLEQSIATTSNDDVSLDAVASTLKSTAPVEDMETTTSDNSTPEDIVKPSPSKDDTTQEAKVSNEQLEVESLPSGEQVSNVDTITTNDSVSDTAIKPPEAPKENIEENVPAAQDNIPDIVVEQQLAETNEGGVENVQANVALEVDAPKTSNENQPLADFLQNLSLIRTEDAESVREENIKKSENRPKINLKVLQAALNRKKAKLNKQKKTETQKKETEKRVDDENPYDFVASPPKTLSPIRLRTFVGGSSQSREPSPQPSTSRTTRRKTFKNLSQERETPSEMQNGAHDEQELQEQQMESNDGMQDLLNGHHGVSNGVLEDEEHKLKDIDMNDSGVRKSKRKNGKSHTSSHHSDLSHPITIVAANNWTEEKENYETNPEIMDEQIGHVLCKCREAINPMAYVGDNANSVDCQGVDHFDGRMLGCCNSVSNFSYLRVSGKIPFVLLCEIHRQRLRRHNCCPGCGLFCSQGIFLECRASPYGIKHYYHKLCGVATPSPTPTNADRMVMVCPHCGSRDTPVEVHLEIKLPRKPIVYLEQRQIKKKSSGARISWSKNKVDTKEIPEEQGVSLEVGEGKVITTVRLALTVDKEKLEAAILSVTAGKPPHIKCTAKSLYSACKHGDLEKVLQVLCGGVNPNASVKDMSNQTPMHMAATSGNVTIAHVLITAGAAIDMVDSELFTPLMLAIHKNNNNMVHYLVAAGAELQIKTNEGMTCLHLAAKLGNVTACRHILDSGRLSRHAINMQDEGGWTALVWGSENKHIHVVKFLLERGGNPQLCDVEQNTALHWAALSGCTRICMMLLDRGCSHHSMNSYGDTPLHIASRQNHRDAVVLLLARGASLKALNSKGKTPLDCAPPESEVFLHLTLNHKIRAVMDEKKHPRNTVRSSDIAAGKEQVPIPCINTVDDEDLPRHYLYIAENTEAENVNIDRAITSLKWCQCNDGCNSADCGCTQLNFRCWYDPEGRLLPDFNYIDPPMIFECNRACGCNKLSCNNRVVQHGITAHLQLFRTKGKGWGVRALKKILKGSYVCEYVGEIITDLEADQRQDDSYLFDLDNRDNETYCIDARNYGNVARFINHLCSPNLTPVKVFIDHQDLAFPRIALYASRDIEAEEELGFDYGEKFWMIKYKHFTCACGCENCRFSSDVIQETLRKYHKKLEEYNNLHSTTPTPPIPITSVLDHPGTSSSNSSAEETVQSDVSKS